MSTPPSLGELASKLFRQTTQSSFRRAGRPSGGGFNGGGGNGPSMGQALGGTGGLILLGLGAWGVNNALFNVDGGHRAIKYTRLNGVSSTIYPEGTHLLLPWLETPIMFDIRTKPTVIPSLTGTKDLQMVDIQLRVLHRPSVSELPQLYQELGLDYAERVLPSIVNEVLKSVVAQFNASQLITQRELVSRLIKQSLSARAERFHIILDDVSITHINFSPAFAEAVEAKQIAQQTAQRAAYLVDQALQEKMGVIVRAQGEARSAELIGEAVKKNKGFLELRRLEAAREIAQSVAQSNNKIMLDADALLISSAIEKENK